MKSKDLVNNLNFQVAYVFEIGEVSDYFVLPTKVMIKNKLEKQNENLEKF